MIRVLSINRVNWKTYPELVLLNALLDAVSSKLQEAVSFPHHVIIQRQYSRLFTLYTILRIHLTMVDMQNALVHNFRGKIKLHQFVPGFDQIDAVDVSLVGR